MRKQQDSTKAQDRRLEEKSLKALAPRQQPSQHDIFPPPPMHGERSRAGRGRNQPGMGEDSFFEEHVKKAKRTVRSETQISEKTAKKLIVPNQDQENFSSTSGSTLTA